MDTMKPTESETVAQVTDASAETVEQLQRQVLCQHHRWQIVTPSRLGHSLCQSCGLEWETMNGRPTEAKLLNDLIAAVASAQEAEIAHWKALADVYGGAVAEWRPVVEQAEVAQAHNFDFFAAGFTAAREQESLISEDGPWHPTYRTADEAWKANPPKIAATARHAALVEALREVLEWRALDGDGISNPLRAKLDALLTQEPSR